MTHYRVIQDPPHSWSYIVDHSGESVSGPWRYAWEAQDYADELNAALKHTLASADGENAMGGKE